MGFLYLGKIQDQRIINKKNYDEIIKVIKIVNCIDDLNDEEEMDEFDRVVAEMERKIKEQQSKNQDNLSLATLISSVANMDGNGLNILNIWDLTIYQFYDQLKRGQAKEQYFIKLKAILAGAKPEDINLEHYMKKL